MGILGLREIWGKGGGFRKTYRTVRTTCAALGGHQLLGQQGLDGDGARWRRI